LKLEALRVQRLRIPFHAAFRHAAAERSESESIWVQAHAAGTLGLGEGCPRPYVTGEDPASAAAFCERHREPLLREIRELGDLRRYAADHAAEIDRSPAAWCALELALLDALAQERAVSVEGLLGLREARGAFRYSAVVGSDGGAAAERAIEQYLAFGLRDFKLKLSGELARDRGALAALAARAGSDVRLRLDANGLWPSRAQAAHYLRELAAPAAAIEEPLAPDARGELAALADESGLRVILDESCTRAEQLEALAPPAARWIVNLRVSKLGGLLRSLAVQAAARARGIPWVVGAQVGETSVLTRAALALAAQERDSLWAQEGAFGTRLLREDACAPVLMFGRGGELELGAAQRPGWGLAPAGPGAAP
jgi:L-Ala-D/L-Glu epimerase